MTRCAPVITHNKHISTPPTLAGLFFCLAPAEGAGLLFFPAAIQPNTSVYRAFCAVHATIPHTAQNVAQGFTGSFPAIYPFNRQQYQTGTGGYNTSSATPERITAPKRPAPIPDTRRRAGRCTDQHSRHTIIRYIRMQWRAACYGSMPDGAARRRPFQPGGAAPTVCAPLASAAPSEPADGSSPPPVQGQPGGGFDASRARRLAIWHRPAVRAHRVSLSPSTRRCIQSARVRRAARNHWRLSPQPFSGFRPIANRGQQ